MEPQTSSLDQYKVSVVNVFDESFAKLQSVLLEPNLETFTGKMFAAGLIGFGVIDKNVTTVYGLFITGINMCNSVGEIKDKCEKFTESLKAIGGPAKTLGEAIENQLQSLNI